MADIRTTGLLDDFQRPDENPLSGGGNWSQTDPTFSGNMQLVSHGATHQSGGPSGDSYWTTLFTQFGSDEVEVWGYPRGGGAGAAGVAWALDLWQQPGGSGVVDGYRFRNESSGGGAQFRLYRITNTATATTIGGSGGFATGNPSTMVMLLRRNGGNVEGWYSANAGANWTLVVSTTDSTYTGSFYIGCGIRDNSAGQILDWAGIGGGSGSVNRPQIYRYLLVGAP